MKSLNSYQRFPCWQGCCTCKSTIAFPEVRPADKRGSTMQMGRQKRAARRSTNDDWQATLLELWRCAGHGHCAFPGKYHGRATRARSQGRRHRRTGFTLRKPPTRSVPDDGEPAEPYQLPVKWGHPGKRRHRQRHSRSQPKTDDDGKHRQLGTTAGCPHSSPAIRAKLGQELR